jgi:hypothetical protein
MYVWVYICIYVYIYVCITYVCIYVVCMYVYMYECMCVRMYITRFDTKLTEFFSLLTLSLQKAMNSSLFCIQSLAFLMQSLYVLCELRAQFIYTAH